MIMSPFVLGLQRLHKRGKVTITLLNTLLSEDKIIQEEYDFIIS